MMTQSAEQAEAWIDKYGDALYRFAFSRVNAADAAEDLVQETFLAALRSLKNFQGRSSERTWLFAILKHKIIEYYRKKNKEQAVEHIEPLADSPDDLFDETGHWAVRPADWAVNPDSVHEQKEFMAVLYKCLSRLPSRQADVFTYREIDGLSTGDICKVLDISTSNTWVMLYRARMGLRKCIEKNWLDTKE